MPGVGEATGDGSAVGIASAAKVGVATTTLKGVKVGLAVRVGVGFAWRPPDTIRSRRLKMR
jgi:hypothetical protein